MRTTAKLLDALSSALCLFVKCCMVLVIGLWPDAVINKARPHARTHAECERERDERRENSEESRERERGERYIERETHTHVHTHTSVVSLYSQGFRNGAKMTTNRGEKVCTHRWQIMQVLVSSASISQRCSCQKKRETGGWGERGALT